MTLIIFMKLTTMPPFNTTFTYQGTIKVLLLRFCLWCGGNGYLPISRGNPIFSTMAALSEQTEIVSMAVSSQMGATPRNEFFLSSSIA